MTANERATLRHMLTRILGKTPFEPKTIVLNVPKQGRKYDYKYVDILKAEDDFDLTESTVESVQYNVERDHWAFNMSKLVIKKKLKYSVTITATCTIEIEADAEEQAIDRINNDTYTRHDVETKLIQNGYHITSIAQV